MPNNIELNFGVPNAKQEVFLTSKVRNVGYGGARGGGKSWAVRFKAALLGLNYPGITILILRQTYPELLRNHILPLSGMLKDVATYKQQDKTIYYDNGSVIIFGYCDTDKDVTRYQGQEYDIVFMDEATHFNEYMYDCIKVCIRGANNLPKRFYFTCNPGGVGHEWVKRLFITKDYRAGENPEDFQFVKATVYDNVNLMESDPEYVRQLESLPPDMRKAWLEGSWDLFAGQFFPEFNPDVHVIDPFTIPDHWVRYRVMDYGTDMLAGYFVAVDEYGNCYFYHEIYEGKDNHMGANNNGHVASEACRRIKEDTRESEYFELNLAPPDLWNRQPATGKSTADIFDENDVPLTMVNNNREHGWMQLRELLRVFPDEHGQPTAKMKIFRTCKNLIRCLPALQYDDKKVNDAATQPHEITHAPDAARYFAVYWTNKTSTKEIVKKVKWTRDQWEDYYNASPTEQQQMIARWGTPERR